MGRKTIPMLMSQPFARWSLATLIIAWTVGLVALWRPPILACIILAALGLRCVGGFLKSYEEKEDFSSYCWYGVSRRNPLQSRGNIVLTYMRHDSFGCLDAI